MGQAPSSFLGLTQCRPYTPPLLSSNKLLMWACHIVPSCGMCCLQRVRKRGSHLSRLFPLRTSLTLHWYVLFSFVLHNLFCNTVSIWHLTKLDSHLYRLCPSGHRQSALVSCLFYFPLRFALCSSVLCKVALPKAALLRLFLEGACYSHVRTLGSPPSLYVPPLDITNAPLVWFVVPSSSQVGFECYVQ